MLGEGATAGLLYEEGKEEGKGKVFLLLSLLVVLIEGNERSKEEGGGDEGGI